MALIGIDTKLIRPLIDRIPGSTMEEKAANTGLSKHKLVNAFKGRASIKTVGAIKRYASDMFYTNFSKQPSLDMSTEFKKPKIKQTNKTYKSNKKYLKKAKLEDLIEEIISRGYEITLRS